MADLSITAASVISQGGARVDRQGLAGATIAAGDMVYKDPSSGQYLLADDDSATAAAKIPTGIALNGAAAGQPLAVHKNGDIVIGAALTPGTAYYLSNTAGKICPFADLATPESPVFIGIARSASVLRVNITSSGVAL